MSGIERWLDGEAIAEMEVEDDLAVADEAADPVLTDTLPCAREQSVHTLANRVAVLERERAEFLIHFRNQHRRADLLQATVDTLVNDLAAAQAKAMDAPAPAPRIDHAAQIERLEAQLQGMRRRAEAAEWREQTALRTPSRPSPAPQVRAAEPVADHRRPGAHYPNVIRSIGHPCTQAEIAARAGTHVSAVSVWLKRWSKSNGVEMLTGHPKRYRIADAPAPSPDHAQA